MIDDLKHWALAATSPGFILNDQVIQVIRMLAIAAVTWAAIEMIGMGRAMAVVQTELVTIRAEQQKLATVVEAKANISLTRAEHEVITESLNRRLQSIETRLDNHSRAMSAIIEGMRVEKGDAK